MNTRQGKAKPRVSHISPLPPSPSSSSSFSSPFLLLILPLRLLPCKVVHKLLWPTRTRPLGERLFTTSSTRNHNHHKHKHKHKHLHHLRHHHRLLLRQRYITYHLRIFFFLLLLLSLLSSLLQRSNRRPSITDPSSVTTYPRPSSSASGPTPASPFHPSSHRDSPSRATATPPTSRPISPYKLGDPHMTTNTPTGTSVTSNLSSFPFFSSCIHLSSCRFVSSILTFITQIHPPVVALLTSQPCPSDTDTVHFIL